MRRRACAVSTRLVIEAADGLGMTAGSAASAGRALVAVWVATAGIRTATVWTIGSDVMVHGRRGQPRQPDLRGLQTEQSGRRSSEPCLGGAGARSRRAAGAGPARAGAARVLRRSRAAAWAWCWGLLLACTPLAGGGVLTVVIGVKNFLEQHTSSPRSSGRRGAGYAVSYREGWGRRWRCARLRQGDIDAHVEYSGSSWAMRCAGVKPLRARKRWRHHVAFSEACNGCSGRWGSRNAYASGDEAGGGHAPGVPIRAALHRRRPSLRLGADLEFLSRPEWWRRVMAMGGALPRRAPMRRASCIGRWRSGRWTTPFRVTGGWRRSCRAGRSGTRASGL